jgi:hypothetical protein
MENQIIREKKEIIRMNVIRKDDKDFFTVYGCDEKGNIIANLDFTIDEAKTIWIYLNKYLEKNESNRIN